ncbi:LysR family transcriptional regulator [uncultured Clostridium sp.]|uniref:LysR family transcriptional regulator n=1 Tax=uncultured Clostridium sp. TaxID=59620 RepID=UPI002633F346|nr:LysR family transcriptional regulator [uncultured Clostridium sp.]
MELLQLKYFQSVAKYENITKAAKELHISQPSLSITIKRLEDELSVPLFNRKGKSLELNQYGKRYLTHINSILSDLENAKSEILELSGEKNTHISLSATATLFLSGLLKNFLTENPDITMTQTINYEKTIIENLKNRSIDFALTCPPIIENDIETIELLEEELVVVIPKCHKLANMKSVYLNELKGENFIELTENYSFKKSLRRLFDQAGFMPNVIFEGDISIISELLYLKKALCIAPLSLCISARSDKFTILKLKDKNNTRRIALSYYKGRYLSELSTNFRDFTIKYYQNKWYQLR